MKPYLLIMLILAFCAIGFGQENSSKPKAKRVMWHPEANCKTANIPQDELLVKPVCDTYVQNNQNVRIIKYKDLILAVTLIDNGSNTTADVAVINNSVNRVLVDPSQTIIFNYKDNDIAKMPEQMLPIPPQKIADKINKRVMWANIFSALAVSIPQTTTSTSTTNGSAIIYDNRGNVVNGTYSGTTETSTTSPNTQAQIENTRQSQQRNTVAQNTSSLIIETSLKANTLFPKQSVNGLIYFKRFKTKLALFSILIDGIFYDFVFSNS